MFVCHVVVTHCFRLPSFPSAPRLDQDLTPNLTQFKMNFYRAVLGNIEYRWSVCPDVLRLISSDYQETQTEWETLNSYSYGKRNSKKQRRLLFSEIDGQREGTAKRVLHALSSASNACRLGTPILLPPSYFNASSYVFPLCFTSRSGILSERRVVPCTLVI